ncbi:UDP-glucose/GDP-mannose dehydrogenase family protein [Wukongibacter baidiensis]|uniref:UDP-glucose dehydrogenase family protein n=1 Tax=Wukongibacter baidiensis TaxID=1723361 RepID=UPI003D7F2711
MNISVIGAGYVGLITSLGFAKHGNKVICVEKDIEKVEKLNKGIPTIFEENLEELLNDCLSSKSIFFTKNIHQAISDSDVVFIAVGTPEMDNWDVDITQVTEVVNQISHSINKYKVIVNKSTVPVGTQKYVKDLLINNGVSKDKFDVVSNPEFLREGKAIHDFLNGDRIVIGYDSEKAKMIMKKLYEPFNSKVVFTPPEAAELIKYASNAFLATKISFINEIANLCNKVGANVEAVAAGMGLDKRISPEFLRAGIGYGGSCFPKDTKALVSIGKKNGCDFKVVNSAIEVNENQRVLPVKILMDRYKSLKDKTITILGLTFKAGTNDIREAPSLYIIEELLKQGAVIKAYDLEASDEIKKIFPNINYCDDLYESLVDSHCAVICTDWPEFSTLDLSIVKKKMSTPMVIDGRNILDLKEVKKNALQYYSVGRGSWVNA